MTLEDGWELHVETPLNQWENKMSMFFGALFDVLQVAKFSTEEYLELKLLNEEPNPKVRGPWPCN